MDDATFQRWNDKLAQLRKQRQDLIDKRLKDEAVSFLPEDFFGISNRSLELIMETWFDFEKSCWEAKAPEDPAAEAENAKGEMESILDFETEAIERDQTTIVSHITWDDEKIKKEEPKFRTFIDELRNKYQLKIKALSGAPKKRSATPDPMTSQRRAGSGSGGGAGIGTILMFFLGLVLGVAPSIYFWDASNKGEHRFQDERRKILNDQRALSDSVTVLHDSFDKLASGKTKNIPMLEAEISSTKALYNQRRQRADAIFRQEKERIMKKIPAGDRQDTAINEASSDQKIQLAEINKQEAAIVDPLTKQMAVLKDLLSQ